MNKFFSKIKEWLQGFLIAIVAYFEERKQARREGRNDHTNSPTLGTGGLSAGLHTTQDEVPVVEEKTKSISNAGSFFVFKDVNGLIPSDVQPAAFDNVKKGQVYSQNCYEKAILVEDSYVNDIYQAVVEPLIVLLSKTKEEDGGIKGNTPVIIVARTKVMLEMLFSLIKEDFHSEIVKLTSTSKNPVDFEGASVILTTAIGEVIKRGVKNPSAIIQIYNTRSVKVNESSYMYLMDSEVLNPVFISVISRSHPKQLEMVKVRNELFNQLVVQDKIVGQHRQIL